MSWLDRVNTDMIITMGDGRIFKPAWIEATKSKKFNLSEFEFINIKGALIDRREPKARRFPFKIFFQGADNLDQSRLFETSSDDKRPWKISHPKYDQIIVHPQSLKFDDTKENVTEITGVWIETISRSYPFESEDPIDEIISKSEDANVINLDFATNEVTLSTDDIDENITLYNDVKDTVPTENKEEYLNLFNEANSKIFEATTDPEAKIQALIDTQEFLLAPARFANSVQARIRIFESQLTTLINLLPSTASKSQKIAFEWKGAAIVNGIAVSTSSPLTGGFQNVAAGLAVASSVSGALAAYILAVNSFQTPNGALPSSYSPNQSNFQALSSLVNYATSNVLNIALNSKQERIIILYSNSNLIELAHRFYGLDADDQNIKDLITQNNWGINNYLQVSKNTEVKYYV